MYFNLNLTQGRPSLDAQGLLVSSFRRKDSFHIPPLGAMPLGAKATRPR